MAEYEVECYEDGVLRGNLVFGDLNKFVAEVGYILELNKFDKLILKIKKG